MTIMYVYLIFWRGGGGYVPPVNNYGIMVVVIVMVLLRYMCVCVMREVNVCSCAGTCGHTPKRIHGIQSSEGMYENTICSVIQHVAWSV